MTTEFEQGHQNYQPPPPPPNRSKQNEPTKAALCAVIPGIGAVYNQDYMKAVVHLAAFASLCVIAEAIDIFGLIAFVFYVYTIFDAYRSAQDPQQKKTHGSEQINMPLWGILLILLGVMFLLDSLDAISLRAMTKFWPLILVFIGFYLVFQYFATEKQKVGRESDPAVSKGSSERTIQMESRPDEPVEGPAEAESTGKSDKASDRFGEEG